MHEDNNIKFSVIIPLYNKERFVKETIESVLAQDYTDYEMIIVDDGSTDNSMSIVKQFTDERIRTIEQKNAGVSAARNKGISLATGEYVMFLDADDIWHNNTLATMHGLTNSYPEDAFFCAAQDDRIIPTLPSDVSIISDHCQWNYIYSTGCICIRRNVFSTTGRFREGIQLGEDRDMWLRIACNHRTIYLNKPVLSHPKETMNNLSRIIHPTKSFPYWEWYSYDYPIKASLYRYATDMLLQVVEQLIEKQEYKQAWFFLQKCKGFTSLRWRVRYAITILKHVI